MIFLADIASEIAIATGESLPVPVPIDVVGMADVLVKGLVVLAVWLLFRNWRVTEY